ncbi:MAG: slipin family protein [Candidatus Competibacteraceae bacterium]|nr:slipin family protein [Candidatus Competibacteraceae bacterium]
MFGYKRFVIAQNERGLLFRDKSLDTILKPGVYRYFDPRGRIVVQSVDISEPAFRHAWEDFLIKERSDLCAEHFELVELGEQQAGLEYRNNKLYGILPPGTRQLYWRGPVELRVEPVDIAATLELPAAVAALLRQRQSGRLMRDSAAGIVQATVADYQRGLLLVDGELKTLLAPGSYAFWAFQREVQVELVDTRLQVLEVAGQEILTKDKVSLRLNLSAHFRVKNPVQVRAELGNYKDYLYRELQFGLRQAVGSRSLDELLADKEQLDGVVATYAQAKVAVHGVELVSVGVKDIILPGEMKTILNQVVEADKAAQANVIRRREETAATRSLLNTARLMDENPTLLRLKELEALEKVTGKIDKLTVFGGLEGVLSGLVSLRKA